MSPDLALKVKSRNETEEMVKSTLGVCAILLGLGMAACQVDRPQTEGQVSATLSVAPATWLASAR